MELQANSELHVLDLDTKQWSVPAFMFPVHPAARSHTTLTPVFPEIYMKDPEADVFNTCFQGYSKDVEFGFYMFGGKCSRGSALKDLWLLQFTSKGCQWAQLGESDGLLPRYSHTSTYIKGMLAIVGGRNDNAPEPQVDQVALFVVRRQKWILPKILGDPVLGRWEHCADSSRSQLIIFGGQSNRSILASRLVFLETDQRAIQNEQCA